MTLYADIDGKPHPLTDCCWIQRAACGCLLSALTAAFADVVFANVEQAHKELEPTKRGRDRDIRNGQAPVLMTFAQYRELNGGEWSCQEHRKPKADAS